MQHGAARTKAPSMFGDESANSRSEHSAIARGVPSHAGGDAEL